MGGLFGGGQSASAYQPYDFSKVQAMMQNQQNPMLNDMISQNEVMKQNLSNQKMQNFQAQSEQANKFIAPNVQGLNFS
jgi:hypothetical protein